MTEDRSDRGRDVRSPEEEQDPLGFALSEVKYLGRMIDGVPREGFVGLKDRMFSVEQALEVAREEREQLRARKEGQDESIGQILGIVRWVGPGGIVTLIIGIVYAIQNSGGGV